MVLFPLCTVRYAVNIGCNLGTSGTKSSHGGLAYMRLARNNYSVGAI